MNELQNDDQDFFNRLIEETYRPAGNLSAHLDCYLPSSHSIFNLLLRDQLPYHLGSYKKQFRCFRFSGEKGVIDFPENWGPFSRALFYYDNNEKNFYTTYEDSHDPYHFCKILNGKHKFEKILFFSEGDQLYIVGFTSANVHKFNRYLSLFTPKNSKVAV